MKDISYYKARIHKMVDIDNRTVMGILIVTIVVSIGGTFISLDRVSDDLIMPKAPFTGLPIQDTGDGYTNINISATVRINMVNATIDFGDCNYNTSSPNPTTTIASDQTEAWLLQNSDLNCTNSDLPHALIIENTGNVNVNLTVFSNVPGSTFFAGAGTGQIRFRSENDEASSCDQGLMDSGWSGELATSSPGDQVCGNFTTGSDSNSIKWWVNMTVPSDANTAGQGHQFTLTFSANDQINY